jgi:hypothetical protein
LAVANRDSRDSQAAKGIPDTEFIPTPEEAAAIKARHGFDNPEREPRAGCSGGEIQPSRPDLRDGKRSPNGLLVGDQPRRDGATKALHD